MYRQSFYVLLSNGSILAKVNLSAVRCAFNKRVILLRENDSSSTDKLDVCIDRVDVTNSDFLFTGTSMYLPL